MADNQNPAQPEGTVPSPQAPAQAQPAQQEPAKPAMGASSVSQHPDATSRQPSGASREPAQQPGQQQTTQEEEKYSFTKDALNERLTRAKKSVLKQLLGVEDEHQAAQLVEKYRGLEKEQEKRRLAEMSERDRERERRKKTERELKEFKRTVHEREVTQAVNEVEGVVTGIAKDLIREKNIKHAIRDFQEFVNKMSEEEADAFYNRESIQGWFEEYAKDYEVGKSRQVIEANLNVGAESKAKPAAAPAPDGKVNLSSRGGLSKKQVNDYLKKLGFSSRV